MKRKKKPRLTKRPTEKVEPTIDPSIAIQLLGDVDKMVVGHQMILEATKSMFYILKENNVPLDEGNCYIHVLNRRAAEKANMLVTHGVENDDKTEIKETVMEAEKDGEKTGENAD